jgi:hypothetical protein
VSNTTTQLVSDFTSSIKLTEIVGDEEVSDELFDTSYSHIKTIVGICTSSALSMKSGDCLIAI